MMLTKRWILIFLLLLSATLVLRADFDLTQWKYVKSILLQNVSGRQLVSILIDNDVISRTDSLEKELRVVEGRSGEVPFNVIADRDEMGEVRTMKAALVDRGVRPGRYQQFICDLGAAGEVSNRLSIVTSSRDFVRRVDLESSDDRQHWLSLAKGLHVFDWSEGRKLKVEFPDSTSRYLKVFLWLDGGKALDIQGAEVSFVKDKEGQLEPAPATLRSKTLSSPEKFSEWVFDFGYGHPLVNRCEFIVGNANFRRRVDLTTSNDVQKWSAGPSLDIFRRSGGDFKDEFTVLETNALNHRYLRIRIFNGDDRPLQVRDIRFQRFVRRVVFEFDPRKSYRLFYGNPAAHRPSYDLAAMEPGPGLDALRQGRLGDEQRNVDFVGPRDRRAWTDRHPAVLWAALIAVVLLLAGLLLRSVRSMRTNA